MKKLKILFLGASRLVGLLERFSVAARVERVELELLSIEDLSPWHAIAASGLCTIVPGPRFMDDEFKPFLLDLVLSRNISLVIPNIDRATVALSRLRQEVAALGAHCVVSISDLCEQMWDKVSAERFFSEHSIRTPRGHSYPLIAKPRFGASSRGQFVFQNEDEYEYWQKRHDEQDYLVQRYISGTEYTVDAYVNSKGKLIDAVSRVRLVVVGGEVMVAKTDRNSRVLDLANRVLGLPGWRGPITVQIIDTGTESYLIEVNPRFGGGVPCSIEAGLDIPRWIIREYLGRPIPSGPIGWRSGLCMTRARKDYFIWLSS